MAKKIPESRSVPAPTKLSPKVQLEHEAFKSSRRPLAGVEPLIDRFPGFVLYSREGDLPVAVPKRQEGVALTALKAMEDALGDARFGPIVTKAIQSGFRIWIPVIREGEHSHEYTRRIYKAAWQFFLGSIRPNSEGDIFLVPRGQTVHPIPVTPTPEKGDKSKLRPDVVGDERLTQVMGGVALLLEEFRLNRPETQKLGRVARYYSSRLHELAEQIEVEHVAIKMPSVAESRGQKNLRLDDPLNAIRTFADEVHDANVNRTEEFKVLLAAASKKELATFEQQEEFKDRINEILDRLGLSLRSDDGLRAKLKVAKQPNGTGIFRYQSRERGVEPKGSSKAIPELRLFQP